MKFPRFIMPLLVVWISQVACFGVTKSYSQTAPIPYDIQIPSMLIHGEKYGFVIVTEPNVKCYAGIAFWDNNDRWIFDDLPSKKADGMGKCKWEWGIPSNAKGGIGEFRGYVEDDNQSTGLIPKTFCMEMCP
jgi:hypothetical protein